MKRSGALNWTLGVERNTSENSALDGIIRSLAPIAPVAPSIYSPPPIPNTDRRVVKFVTDRTSPADGSMKAFATIYDARMSLKRQLVIILPAKAFANLGFLVPPPWGYATAAAAYAVHITATANLVLIGKEWFVLEALEAIAGLFKPVKKTIERQLIPTLSAHADFVASFDPASGKLKPGIINGAVERLVGDLEKRLEVEASLFPEFENLRLPVEPEPKPDLRGTGQPTAGWGSDQPASFPMPELGSDRMRRKLQNAIDKMQDRLDKLRQDLQDLDQFESDIDDRLEEDNVEASEKAELEKEKQEIATSRQNKQRRIEELEQKLAEIQAQRQQLEQALNQPIPDRSDNPSIESVPRQLNQNQERYTQWVRASYPQVDGFRAPIAAWLQQWAPKSKAADHFEKWTNRYTLIKAWQYRSGYSASKSGTRIRWDKRNPLLHMLVMEEAYRGSRDRKGHENWTGDSPVAQREAEQRFTLVGIAHRDYRPLFSHVLYPPATQTGLTSYAQAIFYNANPQQPGSGRGPIQDSIGWDTLNWDPSARPPEWASPATQAAPRWPWEAFDGRSSQPVARVKLNWQAKLMPVRKTRIQETAVTLDGDARKNLEHAAKFLEKLGNH